MTEVGKMDNVWGHYYKGIAAANYFMEHCPADFPEAKYQEKYEEKLKELKLYPYEIQALRAYFHFELLKRYKNIVIADRQFTLEEVNCNLLRMRRPWNGLRVNVMKFLNSCLLHLRG